MPVAASGAVSRRRASFLLLAFCVVFASTEALSADPPEPSKADKRAGAKAANQRVTRADLAAAYLRLEQAYFANPPQGERNTEVNKTFDQATLAFFTGKNADAVRALSELALSLGSQPASPVRRGLMSLKVIVEPQVWSTAQAPAAQAKLLSIYEAPLEAPLDLPLKLRLIGPTDKAVFERELKAQVGPGLLVDQTLPLEVKPEQIPPGLYRVELQAGDEPPLTCTQVSVVGGASLSELRAANEKRLAAIKPAGEELAAALKSCQARNALLDEKASSDNSTQFLADFHQLSREIEAEVTLLEQGKDPYSRRAGDYWRVLGEGRSEIPLRIYAPAATTSETPSPLLIVLHGAGGDENMFLEGYGVGMIKRIADKHGVLIASPSTNKFGGNPAHFDKLLASLNSEYKIDPQRIYVLGHSMGAGATAALARALPDKIAAACCVAGGGGYQGKNGIPPLLAIVAEVDGVIPPAGLIAAAEKAKEAGAPVELLEMPGFGHTLVVGSTLERAVDWVLGHKLAPEPGK